MASELSRRGMIATTFTGNVPHFDIIASDESGRHISVQVKASRGDTWQIANVKEYCEIEFDGHKQIMGLPLDNPVVDLMMVFVRISEQRENDKFYILSWERFRDILIKNHTEYLQKHEGVRPKRWDSLHVGVKESNLKPFEDCWDEIELCLKTSKEGGEHNYD